MKIYIGIDNGLKGGMTVIDEKEKIRDSIVMPITEENKYDLGSIVRFLRNYIDRSYVNEDEVFITIESASPRPVSGKRACFMTGYGFGAIRGIIEALDMNYLIVSPNKWMKDLNIVSKEVKGSIAFCEKKYPKYDWKATDRCRIMHDGKTDSCCIALWCKMNVDAIIKGRELNK